MAHRIRLPIAAAILLPLLLSGCPLLSEYPLSDPRTASVDRGLLGDWRIESPDADGNGTFSFLAFDERELVGIAREDQGGKVEAYRAFTSEIAGERFLNVRELRAGASGWYILRYRIEGDELLMRLVDDALLGGASPAGSAELRAFVERNLDKPELYGTRQGEASGEMKWRRQIAPGTRTP
jgi:hypothetical protein